MRGRIEKSLAFGAHVSEQEFTYQLGRGIVNCYEADRLKKQSTEPGFKTKHLILRHVKDSQWL